MRKKIYLWTALALAVLLLIIAFENIWLFQQYYVLFFTLNLSTTVFALMVGINGFLVGFFAMLYSVEVSREKRAMEESDLHGMPDAAEPETPAEVEKREEVAEPETPVREPDAFDEDDEVLG